MIRIVTISLITLALFFTGCSSQRPVLNDRYTSGDVNYSLIYLIHADSDYLYHNADGEALKADKKALSEAISIGRKAISGEVFIFHLKPERKILWLFPRKDRRVLHFRNGKLITDRRYSPKSDSLLFKFESDFYASNRVHSSTIASKILLYFGHEVPVLGGKGYHQSLPDVKVNALTFRNGIRGFLTNEKEIFDLVVLSTCNNGSPHMAHLLSPISEYMMASPQNLHLSHIDTKDLISLEEDSDSLKTIALQMAENTFQRMSNELHTAITLSLYDLNKVGSYMKEYYSLYEAYLNNSDIQINKENIDCTQLPILKDLTSQNGIHFWYKPPSFGRRGSTEVHSGWGCKRSTALSDTNVAIME